VIEVIKVCREGFSAPKFHIGNLKVVIDCRVDQHLAGQSLLCGEESRRTRAKVVFGTAIVRQEVHRGVWRDIFGMLGDEFCKAGGASDAGRQAAGRG
jgi:hypothetical protein